MVFDYATAHQANTNCTHLPQKIQPLQCHCSITVTLCMELSICLYSSGILAMNACTTLLSCAESNLTEYMSHELSGVGQPAAVLCQLHQLIANSNFPEEQMTSGSAVFCYQKYHFIKLIKSVQETTALAAPNSTNVVLDFIVFDLVLIQKMNGCLLTVSE